MRGSPRPSADRAGALRTAALLLAIPMGFVVVMLVAALQGPPEFRPVDGPRRGEIVQTPPPPPDRGPLGPPPSPGDDMLGRIIAIVIVVVLGATALALLVTGAVLLIRRLRDAWRDRPLRTRTGIEVDGASTAGDIAAVPAAAVIRRGIAEAIRITARTADPGDAIVAAWIGLEQTAADSGVARAPSETPREFTLRIIARRAATERDVTALVDLYERVRFGGRIADEDDRRRARALLERLEEEWR